MLKLLRHAISLLILLIITLFPSNTTYQFVVVPVTPFACFSALSTAFTSLTFRSVELLNWLALLFSAARMSVVGCLTVVCVMRLQLIDAFPASNALLRRKLSIFHHN